MQSPRIAIVSGFTLFMALSILHPALGQQVGEKYTKMAPIDQYLMEDRPAEIALARSAAPASISQDAEVMVLNAPWFRKRDQGQERVRVYRRQRVVFRAGRRLLEPQSTGSDVPERGSRAQLSSAHDEIDYLGAGG